MRQGAAHAVAAEQIDLRWHDGVHPRLGVLDVVPFVALDGTGAGARAVRRGRAVRRWVAAALGVPAFLYGDADPDGRTLPGAAPRRVRAHARPTSGPPSPIRGSGATAVGARPPLVAVNCVARRATTSSWRAAIAREVRERDGGLPGVRALGFALPSRARAQVSMNLVDLDRHRARGGVHRGAAAGRDAGGDVAGVELVGLVPRRRARRCSAEFRRGPGSTDEQTIEGRLHSTGPHSSRVGNPASAPVSDPTLRVCGDRLRR